MSAGQVVKQAMARHAERGPAATRIYVGRTIYNLLRAEAREMGVLVDPDAGELGRLQFCGLPVYKVDAEEHLGVA